MGEKLDSNRLIELIKLHPELYAKGSGSISGNANDMRSREIAWNIIAENLNVNINLIKSRWKSLRDTFHRNLKKARQSENDSVTICWPYFEKLLFLKDHLGQRSKLSNSLDIPKEEYYENEQSSQEEDTFQEKDELENSDFHPSADKFENEEWSQFYEEELKTSPTSFEKISFDDDKSEKFIVTKRKLENADQVSSKRISLHEENEILDQKITQCLDLFKEKLEKKKDAIDNFCEFISSFIKQWPAEEQCETIKYLTEYVMEKHIRVLNNSPS